MISENTRKMSNPFVSFLRPPSLSGGLCDAGQIGRVAHCQGEQNRHKDWAVGAKTRLIWSLVLVLPAPGEPENKDALLLAAKIPIICSSLQQG